VTHMTRRVKRNTTCIRFEDRTVHLEAHAHAKTIWVENGDDYRWFASVLAPAQAIELARWLTERAGEIIRQEID
jgi:hypothetical protein